MPKLNSEEAERKATEVYQNKIFARDIIKYRKEKNMDMKRIDVSL